MKRLRELDASSALLDRAKTLVVSVDAIPESQERMLRVRRELDVPRGAFAFARGVPALSGAGLLLMFGASVFAAVRLFAPASSGKAPPTAAASAEQSGLATHAGGPSAANGPATPSAAPEGATPSAAPPLFAKLSVGHARNAQFAPARQRRALVHARSRHATQLSARVSSRTHAARARAAVAPVSSSAWQTSSASVEAAPSAADASSRSDGLAASASSASLSANAESSSESAQLAKSELSAQPTARAADRVASEPQPSAADDAPAAQPTQATRAPSSSDSELVHRAFKALRHDHDPALAAQLLDQQRAAVHGGPLAEEALALLIEATSQLQQVRSRDFAREYLKRYPNGRYRGIAEKALQGLRL